jgi:hypothetical protein
MPRIVKKQSSGSSSDGSILNILDEGVSIGEGIHTLNFVGDTVRVFNGTNGIAYITTSEQGFSSNFNTENGSSNGLLEMTSPSLETKYISSPDSEGFPFKTGGFANSIDWATNQKSLILESAEPVTSMRDSSFLVEVLDPGDINAVFLSFLTDTINGNQVFTSPDGFITVSITDTQADIFKTKANVRVEISHADILASMGYSSGKVDVRITHNVPEAAGSFVFLLSESDYLNDFFYDGSSSTPTLSGDVVVEQVDSVTKHISGIEYYTTGSRIKLSFDGLDNYNRDTAPSVGGIELDGADTYGITSSLVSPITGLIGSEFFTGFSDTYSNSGVSYSNTLPLNRFNFRFLGLGTFRVGLYDSWSDTPANYYSSPNNILVDTYSTLSTSSQEFFYAENQRTDENWVGWNSENELRSNITTAKTKISIVDNSGIKELDTIDLFYSPGNSITIIFGSGANQVPIGTSSEETISNIRDYLALNASDHFNVSISSYSDVVLDIETTALGGQANLENQTTISTFVLDVGDFELGSSDAIVFRGQLQSPVETALTGGDLNSNWIDYEPNTMGLNPDYSSLGSLPVSFFRKILDPSGISRTSFRISFIGNFVSDATTDLEQGLLKIYVQKMNSETLGGIFGQDAPVLRLHGSAFGELGFFDQGITIPGSYIREGASAGNVVNGTFGTFKCSQGIYLQLMICDPRIKISQFDVVFF